MAGDYTLWSYKIVSRNTFNLSSLPTPPLARPHGAIKRVTGPSWPRSALNQGLNLTRVSFSYVQKHFLTKFSLLFLELPIINLQTKRIKTETPFKLSNLNSNLALTLGYLNPALNNSALTWKVDHYITGNSSYVLQHLFLEPEWALSQ